MKLEHYLSTSYDTSNQFVFEGKYVAGAGNQLDDQTYEIACMVEISVNYIAGLNRLIELAKMSGRREKVKLCQERPDQPSG